MSWAFSVANAKGGVGKTTTAVNMAAFAASIPRLDGSPRHVLIVDLDSQMNATQQLGYADIEPEKTLATHLIEDADLDPIIIKDASGVSGLDLLPSHYHLAYEQLNKTELLRYGTWLRQRLRPVRSRYDLVIFDLPVHLGELSSNAVGASNGLLIPTQPEKHSVTGLPHLLSRTRTVFAKTEVPDPWEAVLVTMYDKRNGIERRWLREIQETYKGTVLQTVIRRNTDLAKSATGGLPIMAFDETSYGYEDYLKATQELLSLLESATPRIAPVSRASNQ
jgi:chromosome partitioning protein